MLEKLQAPRRRDRGFGGKGPNARLRRVYAEPTAARLLWLVAAETGIAPEILVSGRRGGAEAALARQMLMYLLHTLLGFDVRRVGSLLGRNRSTVDHACAVVEDRRDDAAFDRKLAQVESRFLESHRHLQEATHG
ncbi:MAG: helix-turn-helix domain-containing protein [Devosia sp.]